ncbi:MAG TPA: hypothetical protein VLU43_12045 [Anaeromyxobacteraceae bacterium]|nr:hypothetical protein [Anaeromyxobacteraceae bacterium]
MAPIGGRGRPRCAGARAAAAFALAVAACAEIPTLPLEAGPSIRGVKRVALVRWSERAGDARRSDPVDALAEALRGRGLAADVLPLGPDVPRDLEPVARMRDAIRERILGGVRPPASARPPEQIGADLDPVLQRLGAEAMGFSFRFDPRLAPYLGPPGATPIPPPAQAAPGTGGTSRPGSLPIRPAGAFAVVGRGGVLAWIDWAPGADLLDPGAPANAAEAIDLVLRMLVPVPDDDG